MSRELIDKIARAVLYEGYILYPYRPSVKSQQRWTFGGLYPKSWSDAQTAGDPSFMQTECLIHGGHDWSVHVNVRFLHLIDRTVGKLREPIDQWNPDNELAFELVPSLTIGETRYYPWQEATDRDADAGEFRMADLLNRKTRVDFAFHADRTLEPLKAVDGKIVGVLVRKQQEIGGTLELTAVELEDRLFKLTMIVRNRTPMDLAATPSRDDVLMRSLISTHAILSLDEAQFVSMTDPPDAWKALASACTNVGNWPVLIGSEPDRSTILASPIILYDYPQIAPESPGDLFDSTEIDEILSLRILTLTDDEKRAAADVDHKTKEMLARTESLARQQLMGLHGTMRGMQSAKEEQRHG